MDLRSRGEKGGRSFVDTLLLVYICIIGMHFSLPAFAEEYPSFLQNTGDTADSISSEQEMVNKRSSSFFPLRGKKPSLDSPEIPFRYPLESNQQLEDKRSQFYPLRGKKIPVELKRASYFMPMRGRKDDQDWSEEDSIEKRMSSFMPMRGRKDGEEDSLEKRMSSFMPMRGRKDDEDIMDEEDSMEKRMSSFMPMRGRKDDEDSLEKRMSSFMPMRGKKKSGPMTDGYVHFGKSGMYTKDIMNLPSSSSNSARFDFIPVQAKYTGSEPEDLMENSTQTVNRSNQKRSVSFMPMRGIKSLSDIQNEFSGGGGIATSLLEKRRSSFMPMRGRKDSFESANGSFDRIDDYIPMSETRGMPEYRNPNKKKSSFMAMRGRRTFDQQHFNDEISLKEKKRRSQFMPMRGRRGNNLSGLNPLPSDFVSDNQIKDAVPFMPMEGRRFDENQWELSSVGLKRFPFTVDRDVGTGNSPERTLTPVKQTEENTSDLTDADKRASSFMPMRGRRRIDYFYHPYSYHVPSGIGSSLMMRPYSGKMYPISSTWSAATKSRKFDWDSVKRAFHATRGKRSINGDSIDTGKTSMNLHQVPERENRTRNPGETTLKTDGRLKILGLESFHQEPTREGSVVKQDYEEKGCRCKRSILRPRISVKSQRQYIALKRPMSFFATRGKRMDSSVVESKIP